MLEGPIFLSLALWSYVHIFQANALIGYTVSAVRGSAVPATRSRRAAVPAARSACPAIGLYPSRFQAHLLQLQQRALVSSRVQVSRRRALPAALLLSTTTLHIIHRYYTGADCQGPAALRIRWHIQAVFIEQVQGRRCVHVPFKMI